MGCGHSFIRRPEINIQINVIEPTSIDATSYYNLPAQATTTVSQDPPSPNSLALIRKASLITLATTKNNRSGGYTTIGETLANDNSSSGNGYSSESVNSNNGTSPLFLFPDANYHSNRSRKKTLAHSQADGPPLTLTDYVPVINIE